MAKAAVPCPFSNKACTECSLYRGRHHYLSLSKKSGGNGNDDVQDGRSHAPPIPAEFQALRASAESRADKYSGTKGEPKIRVKVIDMESGATRICNINELKGWDWSNPSYWRLVDGWQITNFDRLMEILHSKADTGCEEVDLYEAPRFMLLAGG